MPLGRTRIGLIYPADGDADGDFWRYVPKNVSVMVTRFRVETHDSVALTREHVKLLGESERIEDCALDLKLSRADAIAFACTSGSFQKPGMDTEIARRIEEVTNGIPATTTSRASVEALKKLNVSRVAVLTPYPKLINDGLEEYLSGNGFKVVSLLGLNLAMGAQMCDLSPSQIYVWAKKADVPKAEGLFIACTSLTTAEIIQPLEQVLGKPVTTANQATLWKALQLAGIEASVNGVGRLLESSA